MCDKIESTLKFLPELHESKNAIALIFDLEGFSKFTNQPDIQDYVLVYLNHIFDAISVCFHGGEAYWLDWADQNIQPLSLSPFYEKFLGDGALYLWNIHSEKDLFPFLTNLLNRLWNLKKYFSVINKKCSDYVPIAERPQRIRFGLARGIVHEIRKKNTNEKEYIGFCINLASRLQSYCHHLGFIASSRIKVPEELLSKHDYMKIIATEIKGFDDEEVIVDKDEFYSLPTKIKNEKFKEI